MSSTKRRYGAFGRAITSPALLSTSVGWVRPDAGAQADRLSKPADSHEYAVPQPIKRSDVSQRSRAERLRNRMIDRRQTTNYADPKQGNINEILNKYLNKSTEIKRYPATNSRTTSFERDRSPTISSLMKRYSKGGDRSKSEALSVSNSEASVKWQIEKLEEKTNDSSRANVVIKTNNMPVGGSGSRSGRLARISQSNIRPFGSSGGSYGTNVNTYLPGPGGQPLNSAEPSSPTKKEPKHRFEITKKLGSGTYGKVSLAYDHKFDREVAVKLIKKSAIENKADLVRIRREIRIMSALNHPNIIQIYEVFENKEKIILVMEYSSGGELYDYVSKRGSLPECEARRIFRQITSAVLYCHKHKVAHRDLKLENILLDQNNNAKIADFGLSNYFGEKSLLTTFCGSPLYASPEIINGTPYRGPEVDCWSLGILLYTLVYGSMPFDGRDFNRMVRQIKRGAYYEPETPSTASMLIRNMLRVNPDRRATIFDIASHWWLNLEENMPVIQELPENQIIDHTPLTEREETMVVQDLADEQDVFMEFGHLSSETRRKIEEFRRRRKEAEQYNDESPVKPPKAARKNSKNQEEMAASEKSLRGVKEELKKKVDPNDPLERLKQLETRLSQNQAKPEKKKIKESSPEQPEDPKMARTVASDIRAPSFVPVMDKEPTASTYRARAHLETDSLNMLMNQVLEQMEKGPVSLNIIARIKAHPLYDSRPMVKELLESIIAAQPETIKKQASKVIEQKSQTFSRQNTLNRKKTIEEQPEELPAAIMKERKWHSVEVGFDPDDDVQESLASNATEVTVQDTSFEDDSELEEKHEKTPQPTAPKLIIDGQDQEDEELESEEDEDYTDSEMEELADEVEKKAPEDSSEKVKSVEETLTVEKEAVPPPDPSSSPQYLDAFDRGLIKRQSKGKYQKMLFHNYGRGVSSELESPFEHRKVFGGPQPTAEQSPFLFDKAKEILQMYPNNKLDTVKIDAELRRKLKMEKAKANLLKQPKEGETPRSECCGSVPPRTPPPVVAKSDSELEDESEIDESEEEEGSDYEPVKIRGVVISSIKRDDGAVVPIPPINRNPLSTVTAKYSVPKKEEVKLEEKLDDSDKTTKKPESGDKKESWESAAAYIRRKNRERRIRNRTIGTTDDALRALERPSRDPEETEEEQLHNLQNRSNYMTDAYQRVADSRYSSDYDRNYNSNLVTGSPGYSRRFDETSSPSTRDRRFEVYKTRAERERENPTYHTSSTPYRSTNYYSSGSDRPVTGLRRPEDSYYSRYDNRSTTPDNYDAQPSYANRFRPTSRRIGMSDAEKRSYHRSRSMDRNKIDSAATRLTTPDTYDYSYVNYRDTSSSTRNPLQLDMDSKPRSILKNKQGSFQEPEPPKSYDTSARSMTSSGRDTSKEIEPNSNKKKRSFLSFNRRKTSEVHLGADGKLVTKGYDDVDYKRPSSPIDRIKALFRKTDNSSTNSSSTPGYSRTEYTDQLTGSSRNYAANPASSSSREPYVAQYRSRYSGSSSRDPSTVLNRYSYTSGLSDQRRHWYDDPNIY